MSQVNVSVIVVNYNCHSTLEDCIKSILNSNSVGELLLVDNASTDGSVELVKKYTDPRLKIIRLSRNIGLAGARNLAVVKTTGKYLAFTDADSMVEKDWLQEPCQLLGIHKEIAAVQCKIMSVKYPAYASNAGLGLENFDWLSIPRETLDFTHLLLYPMGASTITTRKIFDYVKGFDSAFFVGHDDIDFGVKLWLSGYAVVCSYQGIVHHDGGHLRFSKDIAPIFHFYGVRNMLTIWLKYLQGRTFMTQVLPFFFLYPLQALWHGGGVVGLKGVNSLFKSLPSILVKRGEIQRLRKISDKQIMPLLRKERLLPVQEFTEDFRAACRYLTRRISAIL